jgi:hypothetical protein
MGSYHVWFILSGSNYEGPSGVVVGRQTGGGADFWKVRSPGFANGCQLTWQITINIKQDLSQYRNLGRAVFTTTV